MKGIFYLTISLMVGCADLKTGRTAKYIKNMKVSNTELKNVQIKMMQGKIRPDWDPMIDRYDERIVGHSYDPENNENTLKSLRNVNTPLIIRVPATEDLYLNALRH